VKGDAIDTSPLSRGRITPRESNVRAERISRLRIPIPLPSKDVSLDDASRGYHYYFIIIRIRIRIIIRNRRVVGGVGGVEREEYFRAWVHADTCSSRAALFGAT